MEAVFARWEELVGPSARSHVRPVRVPTAARCRGGPPRLGDPGPHGIKAKFPARLRELGENPSIAWRSSSNAC